MDLEFHRRDYAADERQEAHTHDHASISLLARGEVVESSAAGSWRATPGEISIKPAGLVHENRYGSCGATIYSLAIADDIGEWRWTFGGPAAALFSRLIVEATAGGEIGELAIDLVAALEPPLRRSTSKRMEEAATLVASSRESVVGVARLLGLHPVALARAFRRDHGCSITEYRRRLRLRRAASLLVSSSMPLADVALDAGFADQSHLCRVFRSEMGMTPSRFRRLATS